MLWRAAFLGAILAACAPAAARADFSVAAGQVTDLRGEPVAGALVKAQSWHSEPLGNGRSDAQGRFDMALSQPVKNLTLIVEHPGFQRWGLSATSPGEDGLFRIRLTRTIGPEYLVELAAQTDPSRFQWLARDLLAPSTGTTGDTLPLAEVLPFLKQLQPRLRALLPAKPAQLKKKDLPAVQRTMVLLLAYLGDPRDDALVDAWASEQNFVDRPLQLDIRRRGRSRRRLLHSVILLS
jgi:hypothetical protein